MKKFFLSLAIILPMSLSFGQIYEENFDYTVGDSLKNQGTWIHSSGSGRFILISAGSLSYPNYPASGIGNSVMLEGGPGSAEDVYATFTPPDTIGCVYAAFLVKVDSADLGGDYFFHFTNNPNTFAFRGRVYARENTAGDVEFGLRFANSGTINWSSTSYSVSDTILLVLKYVYAGDLSSQDDTVKLFINPDISVPEPAPDIVNSDATNSDIQVGAVALRQGSGPLFAQVDGIRVTTAWGGIIPVELTSFTASVSGSSVILNWSTATELNNSGFDILRLAQQDVWEKIAFVSGNGTTTEMNYYSFEDGNLNAGKYSYKLKQIDFDGSYEYSNVVYVDVTNPTEFELSQNYPNPFNPSTTIKFTVSEATMVTLKVFNALGEEVALLVDRIMESGIHQVNFDAVGLNSGIYFYRIEAGDFTQVKKMTLLK